MPKDGHVEDEAIALRQGTHIGADGRSGIVDPKQTFFF